MQATGPMDVGTTPNPSPTPNPAASSTSPTTYARFTLTKRYAGPLQAEAHGEMFTGGDPKAGNAGYVAIETVTGMLETPAGAAAGSFQLMQLGVLTGGSPDLRCLVVPGSATGSLAGLSGTMQFDRTPDGKHTYTFDYTLP